MRSSGSVLALSSVVLILGAGLAVAGGFTVTGVGPRASAMGGAFIGLADDYSAVYWNPAGIVQIEGTEATVSVQDIISLASREGASLYEGHVGLIDTTGTFVIEEAYDFGRQVIQNNRATAAKDHRIAPGLFLYADPGPLRGTKIGLTAYTLADYGSSWDAEDVSDELVRHFLNYTTTFFEGDPVSYESRLTGYVISPVVATKVTPSLSIGVAGLAVYTQFELTTGAYYDSTEFVDNEPPAEDQWQLRLFPCELSENLDGWGMGATIGALYSLNEEISFGVSVRTPITVSLEGDVEVTSPLPRLRSASQSEDFEITIPASVGVGVAHRDFMFDGLTMTADVVWTQWNKVDKIVRNVGVAIPGTDQGLPADLATTLFKWENTYEIGVGVDYRLTRSTSLHLGYRKVPTPSPDETFDFVFPQTDKDVVSFGLGYRQDVWSMDFTLEYRLGQERRYLVVDRVFTLTSGVESIDDKSFEDVMIPSLSFTYGF